ncbi:hypothetical protein BGZ58_008479 [Dissophora ornata]|nr:hypothetical protein BGZ58_008479 [Dissophora ornata]
MIEKGSVMSLSCNIFPAFEQLGLYEDLIKISYPGYCCAFLTSDLKKIGEYTADDDKEITGYDRILFSRPEFYQLLRSRVPAHKIHLSKKVLSFQQNKDGVMVRLQDGTNVHGDVLVGADGAHSAVRQHLYKELAAQGKLPQSDTREMLKGYICMVGTTDPLDPAKYLGLDAPRSDCNLFIGNSTSPFAWSTFTVPGNKICWNVVLQLDVSASEDEQFRNSEWSSDANRKMINSVCHFKTTYGTMGDLFDSTPEEQISRVFLEDILYETWNCSRTVIIGDAAHKVGENPRNCMLLPSTGQGAINAMQDAVILANCLYELKPLTYEGIQAALKDYRDQRYQHVKVQYEASQLAAKLQYGHTWLERVLRHVVFNYMPKSMQKKQIIKESQYRPQASFLPQTPNRGTGSVMPQKHSRRYMEEQAQQALAEAV